MNDPIQCNPKYHNTIAIYDNNALLVITSDLKLHAIETSPFKCQSKLLIKLLSYENIIEIHTRSDMVIMLNVHGKIYVEWIIRWSSQLFTQKVNNFANNTKRVIKLFVNNYYMFALHDDGTIRCLSFGEYDCVELFKFVEKQTDIKYVCSNKSNIAIQFNNDDVIVYNSKKQTIIGQFSDVNCMCSNESMTFNLLLVYNDTTIEYYNLSRNKKFHKRNLVIGYYHINTICQILLKHRYLYIVTRDNEFIMFMKNINNKYMFDEIHRNKNVALVNVISSSVVTFSPEQKMTIRATLGRWSYFHLPYKLFKEPHEENIITPSYNNYVILM
jgi:hypothetical protein